MRILYIHEYFTDTQKNGANIVAFNSYNAMKKAGHEVFFYAMQNPPYLYKQPFENLFPPSHITKGGIINSVKYRLNSVYNHTARRNLEKLLDEIKPDIVHVHSLLELSPSVLIAIKKKNIPYVMTVHDGGFACPVMGTKYNLCQLCASDILNCLKHKCSRNNYLCSLYVMLKFYISKIINKKYYANCYITPSNALKNYIDSCFNIQNIECVPNSLDNVFESVSPNYGNDGYFLYVGGLLDIKGVNILLNAVKMLPRNINFHIAGGGKDENKYKDFIFKNSLTNVKLLGKLNREELIKEYQNCIAVIVPSNLFEIFGMINIEAFINGKPVIASRIGGIPEIVDDGINGLLFNPGDETQLKECILKYWNNPSLVIEHGQNAYKKASAEYTEEKYYKRLIQIYNNVLNNV